MAPQPRTAARAALAAVCVKTPAYGALVAGSKVFGLARVGRRVCRWLGNQPRFRGHFYVECLRRGIAPKPLLHGGALPSSMPPLTRREVQELRAVGLLFVVVLNPGDTYYIPANWLHFVLNDPGDSVTVSVAFDGVSPCMRTHAL